MAVESAADRAAFFNEFAEAGAWTLAAGGDAVTVNVILDREHEIASLGAGEVQVEVPVARCATEDLPAGYGKGDALVVGAVTWTVERVDLDATREIATAVLRAT